jgi:hypothetical protein
LRLNYDRDIGDVGGERLMRLGSGSNMTIAGRSVRLRMIVDSVSDGILVQGANGFEYIVRNVLEG